MRGRVEISCPQNATIEIIFDALPWSLKSKLPASRREPSFAALRGIASGTKDLILRGYLPLRPAPSTIPGVSSCGREALVAFREITSININTPDTVEYI